MILEVDERMLAERQRLGLDRFDEMWDGVLHMAPLPKGRHQVLEGRLIHCLTGPVEAAGCLIAPEIGVFASGSDYRVADLAVFSFASLAERGIDGAPRVVIEVRSPNDESDEKVAWYLGRGARSVVVIDPVAWSVGVRTTDGTVERGPDGLTPVPGVDVRMGAAPDGSALVVATAEGTHQLTG